MHILHSPSLGERLLGGSMSSSEIMCCRSTCDFRCSAMVEAITEHGSAARDRLSMAYGRVRTSDARVECGRATDCYSRCGKGVNFLPHEL